MVLVNWFFVVLAQIKIDSECTIYETCFGVLFQVKTPAVSNDVTVLAPENTVASGPSLKEKRKRKPSVSDVGI